MNKQKLNINDYGVKKITQNEMKKINGGCVLLGLFIVGLIVGGIAGYQQARQK